MTRKDAQQILEIKAYLDENLYVEHSIQSLCRRFMINREKLQTGFHELVHSPVHSYIVRQRVEGAARRLLESEDSIKAIAFASGYRKQRSFNKSFKAVYKLTPATYRRLRRAGVEAVFTE